MKRSEEQFITGKLENGLTYYLGRTKSPAKSADFILVNRTGSLQEEEHERGFAHFVEHLAFAGTENFPGNALTDYLTSIGVRFGTDVNAYTAMDRTVYRIASVPLAEPSVIDKILLILRDWAAGISFEPARVESERAVILEEGNLEETVLERTMKYMAALEQAGSRYARRNVIGLPDIIRYCRPQELADFYRKWYRPPLQAVIIAGDVQPELLRQKVRQVFSPLSPGNKEIKEAIYKIPDNEEFLIGRYIDPQIRTPSVRMSVRFPLPVYGEDSLKNFWLEKWRAELFLQMLSRRLEAAAESGGSPFRFAVPTLGRIYNAARVFRLVAVPREYRYERALRGMLAALETDFRYGFSPAEMQAAVQLRKIKFFKEMARNADYGNREYARRAVEHFTCGDPLFSPHDYYRSGLESLEEIEAKEVNAFAALCSEEKNRIIVFTGPPQAAAGFLSGEQVKRLAQKIKKESLPQYRVYSASVFNFSEPPASTEMSSAAPFREIPGAVEVFLPSGGKIVWIENPALSQTVKFRAVRRGGRMTERGEGRFVCYLMEKLLNHLVSGGMSAAEFNRFCIRNRFSLMPELEDGYDLWRGNFHRENAVPFFRALYAKGARAEADPRSFEGFKRLLLEKEARKSPLQVFRDICRNFSYRGASLAEIPRQALEKISGEEVEEAYRRHFSSSEGFAYIFEGALPWREAEPLAEKYIANFRVGLPGGYRAVVPDVIPDACTLNRGTIRLRYLWGPSGNTGAEKASVSLLIRGKTDWDTLQLNCSRFLEMILRDRCLQVLRRERGGAYRIEVNSKYHLYPDSHVLLSVLFQTHAGREEELIRCVWKELDDLSRRGPSAGEISGIKLYLEKFIAARSGYGPRYLEKAVALAKGEPYADPWDLKAVGTITPEAVKNFAWKLTGQNNSCVFILNSLQSRFASA